MDDPRQPDGWDKYLSKIAFHIPTPWQDGIGIPVNTFVVHFVLVVGAAVLIERLHAWGVL